MILKDFPIENSYQKHIKIETDSCATNNLPSSYSQPDSIDAWRHDRMRNTILPVIQYFPNSSWMTIGDGTFGNDAYYLQNKGIDVLATSISDETLSLAHQLGYIKKFKKINAEKIIEGDNSYDFVFCKEAFHHFPRPFLALYEMLRVAEKGVILIEPQENKIRILDFLKKKIKKMVRKDSSFFFEEKWGNYIYRMNINELSKVMIGLNHRHIAYKSFNDFYFPAITGKSNQKISSAKILFELGIGIQNILCKLKLMDYGLTTMILLKNDVEENLMKSLKKEGFHIKELPVNPYL